MPTVKHMLGKQYASFSSMSCLLTYVKSQRSRSEIKSVNNFFSCTQTDSDVDSDQDTLFCEVGRANSAVLNFVSFFSGEANSVKARYKVDVYMVYGISSTKTVSTFAKYASKTQCIFS